MIPADLAPTDSRSLTADLAGIQLHRITSHHDPHFEAAYAHLHAEFHAAAELESRAVLAARLALDPHDLHGRHAFLYELLYLTDAQGNFAAVRDHTAIVDPATGQATVHLSHSLVHPTWRRTGLAGWLRALPLQTARTALSAQNFPPDSPITLVAEMEPADPSDAARTTRLTAYERAGFQKIDPARVDYFQPDFRRPTEIDCTGLPRSLPLSLVVRRIHQPPATTLPATEVRRLVEALHALYATNFRPAEMTAARAATRLPSSSEVPLIPPTVADPPIALFYDPGFEAPLGNHPMPIRKFRLVAAALADNPHFQITPPAPLRESDLRQVHTPTYLDAVRTGEPRDLAESQKFPWSPALFDSVRLTGGGVLAAASNALDFGIAGALASGFHHASSDHGEGFCTFNSLVVAIDTLVAANRIRTAAILDLDLHYGNGTAQLAETRPHIFALSIYGNDYWDNVPYADVTTRRHPEGPHHASAAIPADSRGPELLAILDAQLPRLLAHGRPDLLLYQAGADPLRDDPYSPLDLGPDDLAARDRRVFEFCRAHAIPVAWVLAGGYTPDVSKVVEVHVNTARQAAAVFRQ